MREVDIEKRERIFMEAAERYCEANRLSVKKLREQRFGVGGGRGGEFALFAQPKTGVVAHGLTNDRETMPYPTLLVKCQREGSFSVEETQYTRRFLSP